ncbi:MAG: SIMPL domain-containing protein [Chloroflexi bacterium]|uniref:SIMPL domain-containing protein n=1 Tax=Candidatus Chlorohelix allophototropha TaxID=3003348 RepID=A0A8T7M5D6_9CHLR|nr:SIMPL domain-containing protein [Chloroflexota bacterium]WJW69254.1 SIMPL domain-containing protein [Chloroflexota bacterium L227-S17]
MNLKRASLFIGVVLVAAIAGVLGGLIFTSKPSNNAVAQSVSANGSQNGVAVSGEGWVLVKPDLLRFNVGVTLKAATVTDAQKQTADKMDVITAALKAQNIKDEDIQTSGYSVNPNYIYNQGQSPILDGYNVNSTIAVTVRDLNKAGAILDEVGKAGANQIYGIAFGRDKEIDLIKQARVSAMADARTKAEQLSQAGGFTLGGVINVTEIGASRSNDYAKDQMVAMPSGGGDTSTTIQGGQFKVVVNVQVTYAIK